MNACREQLEDLALLAGGDLPDAPAHALARHVRDCEGCARLLADLEADQVVLASGIVALQQDDVAPVLPMVMARLAADACLQPHAASPRRRDRSATFGPFARAAAVILAVVGASVLGIASLHEGSPGPVADGRVEPAVRPAQAAAASVPAPADPPASLPMAVVAQTTTAAVSRPASMAPRREAEEAGLPVFVRRSGKADVVLSWAGDGREENARNGRPSTYKVLASGTPSDFEHARPVEVAGSALVASMKLPAARVDDRSITFFRIE